MEKIKQIFTPEVRIWIYNIAIAVMGLLGVLGYLNEAVSAQIALIVVAVLGIGSNAIARSNVTKPTATAPPLSDEARG